jgi:putative PIG3 family NAD(P)H quinone oxidoreductase
MVNRGVDLRANPNDFSLERFDAGVELVDRERIEVLPSEQDQRIVGLAWKELVQVHGGRIPFPHPIVKEKDLRGRAFGARRDRMDAIPETMPETMIAIDPALPGGPEVLQPVERPVPTPAAGEVLIRVEAAGVNRPDVMQRLGLYPPPPGAPTIPGLEVAGRIVGGSRDGERVCALVAGGGYAQYCVAPEGQCLPVPGGFSIVEAAALPETFFTVWTNLFQRGGAKAGDIVLVHGGTSGIGTTAVLLGKAFGVDVIVTAGSAEKCARALAIGAAHAIDYNAQDFVAEVKRITGGAGVDVVLDMVGGDYLLRNLACLAEDGRHVSIAAQRGASVEIPIWDVMRKRLTLTGSTLRARSVEFKAALADELKREVWPHLEAGRIRPVIHSTFPLADAAGAHRLMDSGDHVGKIVLEVSDRSPPAAKVSETG